MLYILVVREEEEPTMPGSECNLFPWIYYSLILEGDQNLNLFTFAYIFDGGPSYGIGSEKLYNNLHY